MADTVDVEFDTAFTWLNKYDDSNLSDPVAGLLNHIIEAIESKNYPKAVYYIDVVIKVIKSLGNNLEKAEAHFVCGYAYSKMGNNAKAVIQFKAAITLYHVENEHNKTIAYWMLGFCYWDLLKPSEAIVTWERACSMAGQLRIYWREQEDLDKENWYANISDGMCAKSTQAIVTGDGFFR